MTPLNELTREKILAMEAGREMDAYIAEARGWSFRERTGIVDDLILLVYSPGGERCEYNFGNRRYDPISGKPVDLTVDWNDVNCPPCYSTDIAAAWEIRQWLAGRGVVRIQNGDGDSEDCHFLPFQVRPVPDGLNVAFASAPSPSLAICRAFLLATLEIEE